MVLQGCIFLFLNTIETEKLILVGFPDCSNTTVCYEGSYTVITVVYQKLLVLLIYTKKAYTLHTIPFPIVKQAILEKQMLSHNFVFFSAFCVKARKMNYLHQLNQQQSASLKQMNIKCE